MKCIKYHRLDRMLSCASAFILLRLHSSLVSCSPIPWPTARSLWLESNCGKVIIKAAASYWGVSSSVYRLTFNPQSRWSVVWTFRWVNPIYLLICYPTFFLSPCFTQRVCSCDTLMDDMRSLLVEFLADVYYVHQRQVYYKGAIVVDFSLPLANSPLYLNAGLSP